MTLFFDVDHLHFSSFRLSYVGYNYHNLGLLDYSIHEVGSELHISYRIATRNAFSHINAFYDDVMHCTTGCVPSSIIIHAQ